MSVLTPHQVKTHHFEVNKKVDLIKEFNYTALCYQKENRTVIPFITKNQYTKDPFVKLLKASGYKVIQTKAEVTPQEFEAYSQELEQLNLQKFLEDGNILVLH